MSEVELSIIEQVASRVARGQTIQQIAIDADLDIHFVERVLALPKFEQVFKNIDPEGYSKWKDSQADLHAKRLVMTMAREDSVEYYKMARDIVKGSGELRDKEKLDAIFNLLKMAKVSEGEQVHEVVQLSKDNLATILEAWGETEK